MISNTRVIIIGLLVELLLLLVASLLRWYELKKPHAQRRPLMVTLTRESILFLLALLFIAFCSLLTIIISSFIH